MSFGGRAPGPGPVGQIKRFPRPLAVARKSRNKESGGKGREKGGEGGEEEKGKNGTEAISFQKSAPMRLSTWAPAGAWARGAFVPTWKCS